MRRCANVPQLVGADVPPLVGADVPQLVGPDAPALQMAEMIGNLGTQLRAQRWNSAARIDNSFLTEDADELVPFHDVETNQPIPNFPETRGDMDSLTVPVLNSILRALDLNQTGPTIAKRKRVRRHIGIETFVIVRRW